MPRQQVVRGKAPYDVIEVDEMGFPRCRHELKREPDRPRPVFDKRRPLEITPHYTNDRFNHKVGHQPQTVFGEEPPDPTGHPGLHYDYSDRLWQADYGKSTWAWKEAEASGAPPKSAEFLERYLATFYNKRVEVVHVMAGVNRSNGGSYWIAGWRERGSGS